MIGVEHQPDPVTPRNFGPSGASVRFKALPLISIRPAPSQSGSMAAPWRWRVWRGGRGRAVCLFRSSLNPGGSGPPEKSTPALHAEENSCVLRLHRFLPAAVPGGGDFIHQGRDRGVRMGRSPAFSRRRYPTPTEWFVFRSKDTDTDYWAGPYRKPQSTTPPSSQRYSGHVPPRLNGESGADVTADAFPLDRTRLATVVFRR